MKKAYELSTLCQCEIGIIIFSQNKKLFQYASSNMDHILLRYTDYNEPHESKNNDDIKQKIQRLGSKAKSADDKPGEEKDGSDDDDDDEDEPQEIDSRSQTALPAIATTASVPTLPSPSASRSNSASSLTAQPTQQTLSPSQQPLPQSQPSLTGMVPAGGAHQTLQPSLTSQSQQLQAQPRQYQTQQMQQQQQQAQQIQQQQLQQAQFQQQQLQQQQLQQQQMQQQQLQQQQMQQAHLQQQQLQQQFQQQLQRGLVPQVSAGQSFPLTQLPGAGAPANMMSFPQQFVSGAVPQVGISPFPGYQNYGFTGPFNGIQPMPQFTGVLPQQPPAAGGSLLPVGSDMLKRDRPEDGSAPKPKKSRTGNSIFLIMHKLMN